MTGLEAAGFLKKTRKEDEPIGDRRWGGGARAGGEVGGGEGGVHTSNTPSYTLLLLPPSHIPGHPPPQNLGYQLRFKRSVPGAATRRGTPPRAAPTEGVSWRRRASSPRPVTEEGPSGAESRQALRARGRGGGGGMKEGRERANEEKWEEREEEKEDRRKRWRW